ncbi:MAG: 2-C-methyl-D-erythritol 4-phosphate cytidylyltransferase [Actinomycetaceae bacterium]|nr:2-C-methyl-D-erythritol 4-phosphate cytidylyltransferase [Actinomycetaceae bacterium]MDY6082481.1 2-C-methyl-D-erythritol 4-phosphate cytidylyltransferase [Actinomycetaceae bacterium]
MCCQQAPRTEAHPVTIAILVGAGSGQRLGGQGSKALVRVGGTPLLSHAVSALISSGAVDGIVIAAPAHQIHEFQVIADQTVSALCDAQRTRDRAQEKPSAAFQLFVTAGGNTRQESVTHALAVMHHQWPDAQAVLVHDAARALAPATLIRRVALTVWNGADAVVPALPVTDTIKEVRIDDPDTEFVVHTPERSMLRAVQTPQGFTASVLVSAHQAAAHDATLAASASDDALLVEQAGHAVRVIPGDPAAMKITYPQDLRIAEMLYAPRSSGPNSTDADHAKAEEPR